MESYWNPSEQKGNGMKDIIIGIDIGGTHLRIGAVDSRGAVSCFEKRLSSEVCGENGSALPWTY